MQNFVSAKFRKNPRCRFGGWGCIGAKCVTSGPPAQILTPLGNKILMGHVSCSSNGFLWSTPFSLHRSRANHQKLHALLTWAIALSDQRTLFFDSSLVALHSFPFTHKIKDHSSLLSARSIYKSDVPSSGDLTQSIDSSSESTQLNHVSVSNAARK